MPLKKIVVLVSGSGTNLQCLIDKIHNKYAQIVAVISDVPDAYALKRAENTGIAAKTFDYRSYQNKNLFYDDFFSIKKGATASLRGLSLSLGQRRVQC